VSRKKDKKGSYGQAGLPVARRYVLPQSRTRMVLLGLLAVVVLLGVVTADRLLRNGGLLSNGPLSSSHAGFEGECASCHAEDARQVTNEKCSTCHEKYGDELGVYTFGAHYVYHSDDFRRLVESEDEVACGTCHAEHEGREATLTSVADSQCLECHDYGSFESGHPEFAFAAEGIADNAALPFPHIHHVREVMKTEGLEDLERACLYCHNASDDGRHFESIDFDRHCDTCHLTATTATPALPVKEVWSTDPGVQTLENLVASRGPATRWALYTNPNEFRRRGASISKSPVHHEDPWVLENLRGLRRVLYPEAGLADLLKTSPSVGEGQYRQLYQEAISTLEMRALGLRGRPEPEIQRDLARIDELLTSLRREIDRPLVTLDENQFLLSLDSPNPDLGAEDVIAIEDVVSELTTPCRQCHVVENATISRVQKNQRVLERAHFDHRAHILQRRCLDCHSDIPFEEFARTTETVEPSIDRAEIQNIPRVEVCRECHTAQLANSSCVTCHDFHPNKGARSDLLLYLE